LLSLKKVNPDSSIDNFSLRPHPKRRYKDKPLGREAHIFALPSFIPAYHSIPGSQISTFSLRETHPSLVPKTLLSANYIPITRLGGTSPRAQKP
jgi:hypothetical protein